MNIRICVYLKNETGKSELKCTFKMRSELAIFQDAVSKGHDFKARKKRGLCVLAEANK